MHKASRQRKKAACMRTPRTALYKPVGGAKQRTFEHTFVSTTTSHRNYTASNVVNARPRNSCVHAGYVSCVKSYFASFGPKNLQFFILAFVLRFRTTKSVIAESGERPGSEQITLQIQPQQLARFELRSQQNTFT